MRNKRIALAGKGGISRISPADALALLDVEKFNIADLDSFELANFNRQASTSLACIGRHKAEVLTEQFLQINPECGFEPDQWGITCNFINQNILVS